MKKFKFPGFEETICGILIIILFFAIVLQVLNRFLIRASIPWTEELARYCFIWLSFIGIATGVKRGRHMSVDILKEKCNPRQRQVLGFATDLVLFVIFAFVIWYGIDTTGQMMEMGGKSAALGINKAYVYMACPVGLSLACIRMVQKYILKWKRRNMEEKV